MNTLCAFSSDSRELYRADIYRVLALPKNYIVHFRYKKQYVENQLLTDTSGLRGQRVVVFYTCGNKLDSDEPAFKHFSIRWATITTAEFSEETEVFHIYMKLGDFCNVHINTNDSNEGKPPTEFFTMLSCTESYVEKNWQSRILAIKDFFPDITFFHLKAIRNGWGSKHIYYNYDKKSCHYNLAHGEKYILELAVANPNVSDTKIEISDSSEEITINCINPFESSIQFDDHDIPISVKTLQVFKQTSLLEFKPTEQKGDSYIVKGEYSTNIELNLTLSLKRPLVFGLFSTMAFWAVMLAKPISSSAIWPSDWKLVCATVLFYFSSSSLFFWFNKR